MYHYSSSHDLLHGSGTAALAGARVGAPVVLGSMLKPTQNLTQVGTHTGETSSLHLGKKDFLTSLRLSMRLLRAMMLHASETKSLQGGWQAARHCSWMSAVAGGPMDNRTTSTKQAAAGTPFLSTAALAEAIGCRYRLAGEWE
jgi:hypothetical protein